MISITPSFRIALLLGSVASFSFHGTTIKAAGNGFASLERPVHVLTVTRMAATEDRDAMSPTTGTVVTIECCLRPEGDFVPEPLIDGICVDPYDKPRILSFVLGEGNYLPGLHELVSTMRIGDTAEESLDAGWGDRNPNLEAWINFEDMGQPGFDKSSIKEGVQLLLANGMKAFVTELTDEKFKIDANPPCRSNETGCVMNHDELL